MVEQTVTVQNRAGVHARPAAMIAQLSNKFKSEIMIEKEDYCINAKSVMGVITMAAGYKTPLTIKAEGTDEKEALSALVSLFEKKFDED
ncbi:MAG: HPr family phosphocarrier protein [Treponemataceae bacterium]